MPEIRRQLCKVPLIGKRLCTSANTIFVCPNHCYGSKHLHHTEGVKHMTKTFARSPRGPQALRRGTIQRLRPRLLLFFVFNRSLFSILLCFLPFFGFSASLFSTMPCFLSTECSLPLSFRVLTRIS